MRRIARLIRTVSSERGLLWRTTCLLWSIRIGLWLLPFRLLRSLVARGMSGAVASPAEAPEATYRRIKRITWAVTRMSRYVPKATCLTQALTTQILLFREGYPSSVEIGVGKGPNNQFQAHAWVEYQGWIVIGGRGANMFTPITSLQDGVMPLQEEAP